jgi:hypothetical protein
MKHLVFILTSLCLLLLFPQSLWALTPEESRAYSEYQKKMVPLSEKLQKDIQDCGNDMACQMQVMFRFQSEMAKLPLPDVSAYPSTDCGLMGSPYPNCRNVRIDIRYAFDEKIHEWENDGPQLRGERSLAFDYTVDGYLGYDDDFTQVQLTQRHPPFKEDIHFEDGKYRSYQMVDGVRQTDTNISLGNVDMNDPRSLIAMFSVATESPGEKAVLEFTPFDLVTGRSVDDPAISAMSLPPDGYDEISINPKEMKSLVPDRGHWTFSRTFSKRYDDMGSTYQLRFTVNVTSKASALATGDPKPPKEKDSGLVVSPDEPFKAIRTSKKFSFKPNEKIYTLTNMGDKFLSYSVTADVPWLYPQSESGDLKPKDSRSLTFKLNAQADLLDEKKHLGTLQFINTTGGKGSTSRQVMLSTGQKWRFSYYGYNHHSIGGSPIGGLVVFWRTDVDFIIRDDTYQGGQGHSYLVKNQPFSKPPGIFDCVMVKGNWIDPQLKDHPTPYVSDAHFSISGHASQGFVTLNFPNTSNEYYIHMKCAVDTQLLKKYGFNPSKKGNSGTHHYAGRVRPAGSQAYPLQNGWLREYGTKGVSMDYEACEMRRLE